MSVYNSIQIKQLSSEITRDTEWYDSFNTHQLSVLMAGLSASPLAHTNTSKQSKDQVQSRFLASYGQKTQALNHFKSISTVSVSLWVKYIDMWPEITSALLIMSMTWNPLSTHQSILWPRFQVQLDKTKTCKWQTNITDTKQHESFVKSRVFRGGFHHEIYNITSSYYSRCSMSVFGGFWRGFFFSRCKREQH